jgi:hypothetical protein
VYKWLRGTHFKRVHEIDLDSGRRADLDTTEYTDALDVEGALAADRPSLWKRTLKNF